MNTHHVSVLGSEVRELLLPFFKDADPAWLVDCTFGGGGHSAVFLADPTFSRHRVLGLDQDNEALARARDRFGGELENGRLHLLHANFSRLKDHIGDRRVLGILADVGLSSDQLDDPSRGFSFLADGPLDMRMNSQLERSAFNILADYTEKDLAELIYTYGEERFSRRIAGAIVQARSQRRLPKTTKELAKLVAYAVPASARHGRVHVATRTFQALRIEVNQELEALASLLTDGHRVLASGGGMGIISFHSLEDRLVKRAFRERDKWNQVTKKPVVATKEECRDNPRSRSAKLRVAQKTAP